MKIKKIIIYILSMYYLKEMVFISPCRKILIKISIYVVFLFLAMLICFIPHTLLYPTRESLRQMRFPSDLKYILFWKPQSSKINYEDSIIRLAEGQKSFIKQKCEYVNCYITYDKHFLKKDHKNLDAVIFNVRDIVNLTPKDFKLMRSFEQKYVFYSSVSSERYPVCNTFFDNFFNLTWTYKLDSDIPHPFFNVFNMDHKLIGPKKYVNWTDQDSGKLEEDSGFKITSERQSRKEAVALVLTKCKIKFRYQDFIRGLTDELKGYNYTLDIYGSCGDKKCREQKLIDCYKMIEKKYYFQLILEDSLAVDYVTERIAKVMSHKIIPIIIGVSDYRSFLPPGSYINAQTFDVKKLGAIINYLIRYPNTYERFFHWKKYYYYTVKPRFEVCSLCSNLNSNQNDSTTVYDFRMWWNNDYVDACRNYNYALKST